MDTSAGDQEQPQHFAVPVNILQAIANYLGTKPHNEVRELIDAILQCKPVLIKPEVPEVEEPITDETKT